MNYSEKENPIISVLLPVYNGGKYLADAIDSILAQTFTDFELIIINDGSTDGTLAILQGYQKIDNRIRLVSRENKGLVATLNEGIDIARGTWLARMDADDIALPTRFERQLQWLSETETDICGSWIKFFGSSDQRIIKFAQTDVAIKVELLFMSPLAHPTVIMKTALVRRMRYDIAWEGAEDYDLWERLACAGYRMTNVPEVLLWYRHHSAQISSRKVFQQLTLAQAIRRRCWQSQATSLDIKQEWIEDVLKTQEPIFSLPNMDYVDLVFTRLLQSITEDEARTIAFRYLTQAYLRVAGSDASVVAKWNRLHQKFGKGLAISNKIKLYLFAALRLNPNIFLVIQLRKIRFYLNKLFE